MGFKVVILGCGRSGTQSTAARLLAMNLQVEHERLGPDGGVGYPLASSAWRDQWQGKAEHVLLQVREPWAAISSLATFWGNQQCLAMKELPDKPWYRHVGPGHGVTVRGIFAAQYYVWWNQHCLTLTDKWYRVEDLDNPVTAPSTALVKALQRPLPAAPRFDRPHVRLSRDSFQDYAGIVRSVDQLAAHFGYLLVK